MITFKEYLLEESKKEKKGEGFGCLMAMYDKEFKSRFKSEFSDKIKKNHLYEPDTHGLEKEPHVTVKYGLHEKNHKKVLDFVKEEPPIQVKLKKISLFENEEFDVLKIDISGRSLFNLNKKICKEFNYTDRFKVYHPHTTIAYLKSGLGQDYLHLNDSDMLKEEFTIHRLCYSDYKCDKKYIYLK